MRAITLIFTSLLVIVHLSLHASPPCFVISTESQRSQSHSASAVRETREHLRNLKETGQNIYGAFEYPTALHEYQLPYEEQQSLPYGFKDNFHSVSYLWHIFHNPSAAYFHNKLDSQLDNAPPDQHANIMRAEMRRWGMYVYPEFCEFLQDLLVYNNYMLHVAHKISANTLLKESITHACAQAPDYIAQEAQRITALQQQEAQKAHVMKLYRDRYDTVNNIFESQRSQLETQLTAWEQEHPERTSAYQKTRAPLTQRARYSQHHRYTVSQDANTFLRAYNLNPQNYTYESGNAFQHELMQEIVAGIHNAAAVELPSQAQNPFAHHIMYHTAHAFDDARQTNTMGDCVSSIKLIDIAHTLLNYCKKVGSGAINLTLSGMNYGIHIGKGIFYTTRDACIRNANYVLHPLDSVSRILQFPFALGELINAYVPIVPDAEIATREEWEAYFHQLPIAEKNCRQLTQNIKEWWHTTPSEEILQQATYVIAGAPINAFIANRMVAFTMGALRYSKHLAIRAALHAIAKLRARRTPRLPGPVGIGIEYIDVEAMPAPPDEHSLYMLQPAPVPPPSVPAIIPANIITAGTLIGIAETTITKALENFIKIPDIEGCSHVIERCFKELSHLPGFTRLMKNTLTECSVGGVRRGKGGVNELRSALVLKDKGHSVKEFGQEEIGDYPPDIITDQYLVECKNWDFEKISLDAAKYKKQTEKLMIQLANAVHAGKIVNKKILFMSKKPISSDIYKMISDMGIEIMEG